MLLYNKTARSLSTLPWYKTPPPTPSPPPPSETHRIPDFIITIISNSIYSNNIKPVKKLLHSIKPQHINELITKNPNKLRPNSILQFFNWFISQPGIHLPLHSYSTLAHFLCTRKLNVDAGSILRFVVSKKGRNSAYLVFNSIIETKDAKFSKKKGSSSVYGLLMNAYLENGLISDCVQCFRLIRKHGIALPVLSSARLFDYLLRSGHMSADMAFGFYKEIIDYGFSPNVFDFNILINRFCKDGRIRDAQKVFDEISVRSLGPNVVSYNTLMNGYCKVGNFDECFRLKCVMEDEKVDPDVFTYSVLISRLCKDGRLDDGNRLLDEMCERGLIPNDVVYTSLINGHCKHTRVVFAFKMFAKMLKNGFQPDLFNYNVLIHSLCKNGDLQQARKVALTMPYKPDEFTYTTLIDGYSREGDFDTAFEIKSKMAENEIIFDDVAFSALISGLCKYGRVIDAERLFREMISAGYKPDVYTYNMIIDGFCKLGDVKMGSRLFKEMQKEGRINPGVVTYNVLMNGFCKLGQMKNAEMLLNAMINAGVIPDAITYNILLDGHSKFGDLKGGRDLRSEIGFVCDYDTYRSLVGEVTKV